MAVVYVTDGTTIFDGPEDVIRGSCAIGDTYEEVLESLRNGEFFTGEKSDPPQICFSQVISDACEDLCIESGTGYVIPHWLSELEKVTNQALAEHWESLRIPLIGSESFSFCDHYGDKLEEVVKEFWDNRDKYGAY